MSFDHAASFGRAAEAYRAHRPTWPGELLDWIAAEAPSRSLAVDVATGGGQAALGLAERFDRVIATDRSGELLDTIPRHLRLTTLIQPAEELRIDGHADVVAVFQALHWFHGEPFWSRVRATLRPGGLFVAACYAWFYVDPAVGAVSTEFLLPALAPHWSPRNQLLFDGYSTIDVPFNEIATPEFTIRLTWTRTELVAYVATWSAVAKVHEGGRDILAELDARLRQVWPDDEARSVRMPIHIRAFRT